MFLSLEKRILAFSRLGETFKDIANVLDNKEEEGSESNDSLFTIQRQSSQMNPWFTRENISYAFRAWSKLLTHEKLTSWTKPYNNIQKQDFKDKRVAVINAGNIPLVGFHDFLSVLISGHRYQAKNASDDIILLPYVASLLIGLEPDFKTIITFTERLADFDVVIATGSNNSSRYFNYYFGKYPHIIRKNRNAVAVLDGTEAAEFFRKLGEDIFRYFGLGCRNVSKVYVPSGYDFDTFFKTIYDWNAVMQHNKYMNNFEHHNAVLLLKRIPFLQNGFLIVMENESFASPVAVLNYEHYSDLKSLTESLRANRENIQCIVTSVNDLQSEPSLKEILVEPGKSQQPGLAEYADGMDTMSFLGGLQ